MEAFIERSNALLLARPNTTRVTSRYTHKKVADGGNRVDSGAKQAKVVFKTYDSKSGIVYKYKVRKHQELSRILASLGPQYFEFESERKRGLASIMINKEPQEPSSMVNANSSSYDDAGSTNKDSVEVDSTVQEQKVKSKKKKTKKH